MEWWKQKFIQEFDGNRCFMDLLDMIDEDKLLDYIQTQFKNSFTDQELVDLFKYEVDAEELLDILDELGIDTDEVDLRRQ